MKVAVGDGVIYRNLSGGYARGRVVRIESGRLLVWIRPWLPDPVGRWSRKIVRVGMAAIREVWSPPRDMP